MRVAVLFVFMLSFVTGNAQAPFFETYFGSGMPDYGRSLKQMNDGYVYLIGNSNDTINFQNDTKLYKLDANGNLIWTKNLGDSLDDNSIFMQKSPDGNLLICGEEHTLSNHLDGVLMKVDTSGNLIWKKLYGGSEYESFNRLAVMADGNIVLTGFQTDNNFLNGIYVVYTDANGTEIWSGNYGGTDNDIGASVCALPDSGFIIAGDTRRLGGDYDIECMRFSKNGTILWDSVYTDTDTVADGNQGVILLSDGNLLLFGESQVSAVSWFDFHLHKIDLNGNTIWEKKIGGANPDAAFSVLETNGEFIGTGYSTSFSPGPNNIIVFRCDANGNLLWAHPYGGPGIDIGYEMIPAIGGGFYIAATGNINGDDQCGLLHVDDAGWASVNEIPENGFLLFPNPANETVSIQQEETGEMQISVYSAEGKLQLEEKYPQTKTATMNIKSLAAGMYFIRVQSGENAVMKKLLVE